MTFADLLTRYGVDHRPPGSHHHSGPNYHSINCPYCAGTGKFRMGFHLTRKFFTCFCCGYKPVWMVLRDITHESRETVDSLIAGLGVSRHRISEADSKPRGKLKIPVGVGELLPAHRRYLKQRGFDPEELTTLWGVQGIGIAPALSWRIWIPIRDAAGVTVSWTTRSIVGSGIRYITARPEEESVGSKDLLFGEDMCRHAVLVTEGPLDAMAIGPGAVATLGMKVSKKQITRIARFPVRCLVFDHEDEAQQRAKKLCEDLSVFAGETYRIILSGKDAASSPKEEIQELRERFLS